CRAWATCQALSLRFAAIRPKWRPSRRLRSCLTINVLPRTGFRARHGMPTGVWLPAFEMQGGVDLMRCPSIVSTVEAFGASPAAAVPAAMRGRSYGVAGPAAIDGFGHRIGRGWVRDHRRR